VVVISEAYYRLSGNSGDSVLAHGEHYVCERPSAASTVSLQANNCGTGHTASDCSEQGSSFMYHTASDANLYEPTTAIHGGLTAGILLGVLSASSTILRNAY
jgi:hypothetical protein